jgi:hypothetical protein
MKGLNDIIDNDLSGHPSFQCKVLHIGNEHLDFYCRDTLQCIRTLYGDPAFAQELALSPVQVYTDAEKTCRVVNKMHTGDWWWSIQVCNVIYDEDGDLDQIPGDPGIKTARCNRYTGHPIIGQDFTNTISEQGGISSLYDHWKYPEGHPPQAVSACADLNRLHSNDLLSRCYEQGRPTARPGKPFPCVHGKGLSSDQTIWRNGYCYDDCRWDMAPLSPNLRRFRW